jgi:hypothetical protein
MWLEGIISKRDNRAAWRHGRTVPYTVGCRYGRWERFDFAGRNKRLLPVLLIGDVLVEAVLIDARYGKTRVPRGERNPKSCRRKSPRVISIWLCRQQCITTTMPAEAPVFAVFDRQ